jgi:hypothetical protein
VLLNGRNMLRPVLLAAHPPLRIVAYTDASVGDETQDIGLPHCAQGLVLKPCKHRLEQTVGCSPCLAYLGTHSTRPAARCK